MLFIRKINWNSLSIYKIFPTVARSQHTKYLPAWQNSKSYSQLLTFTTGGTAITQMCSIPLSEQFLGNKIICPVTSQILLSHSVFKLVERVNSEVTITEYKKKKKSNWLLKGRAVYMWYTNWIKMHKLLKKSTSHTSRIHIDICICFTGKGNYWLLIFHLITTRQILKRLSPSPLVKVIHFYGTVIMTILSYSSFYDTVRQTEFVTLYPQPGTVATQSSSSSVVTEAPE